MVARSVPAVILLTLLACGAQPIPDRQTRPTSAPGPDVESTARARLEAWVGFLASDALGGRGTPSAGLEVAAEYLASELRRVGWKPGNGDSYRQPWTLGQIDPNQAEMQVSIGGEDLAAGEFLLVGFGYNPKVELRDLPLVSAGYGVFAPERGVDDYEGLDVAGKAVLVFEGATTGVDAEAIFGFDHGLGKQLAAVGHGARMTVYVTDDLGAMPASPEMVFFDGFAKLPIAFIPEIEGATGAFAPIVLVSKSGYDRALAGAVGCSYDECQARLSKGERVEPGSLPSVTAAITAEVASAVVSNVVATLPGGSRADEWIVLSAHYDHLGTAPGGEDPIYNGADDNASGTAALLEVARRLAAAGGLERSVMVLYTSGEERGLLGAAYYAHAPLVPLAKTVLNINVDMVGRSTGSLQAQIDGAPALFEQIVELGADRGLEVLPDQQPTWRVAYLTDHYHFLRHDIPAVEFFTGLHGDYHQPTDDAGKIRYTELAKITDIIYQVTRHYAGGAALPAYERPVWLITP